MTTFLFATRLLYVRILQTSVFVVGEGSCPGYLFLGYSMSRWLESCVPARIRVLSLPSMHLPNSDFETLESELCKEMNMFLSDRGKRLLFAVVLTALLVLPSALAQETTGGLQGTVKDTSGALIVKATVEVASPALIGTKKTETNQGGYFRFANLPSGVYAITIAAPGFRTYKEERISLAVGRLPTLDITMQVGTIAETVEVSAQAVLVDTTQSKVQTNISESILNNVPTGRTFQSVIQFAPGARSEPLQNGYQIEGASNSENSYLVEGLETASVFDGHSAASVPMDFIQEVQVKSSGFEAEYGGALGGVVNVIQKRGSNDWHGAGFLYYQGSSFDADPATTLIKNPLVAANAGGAKRLDQPAEFYQPKQDRYRYVTPGFSLGGPMVKDRLWLFASTAPEFQTRARTVNFAPSSGVPGDREFHQNTSTYYSLARLDFLATQKIRLYGSWAYSYVRTTGFTMPQADDVAAQYNSSSTTNPDNWNGGIANVKPNVIYTVGADVSATPNVILTTRFGYFHQNNSDRGRPTGVRYIYRDTNYPYAAGSAPAEAGTTSLGGNILPTDLVHATGWSNIGDNTATSYDVWDRYNFNQDLAFFKKGLGTHNFKFGYAFNHGLNKVLTGYDTADVYVAFNVPYAPATSNGIGRCKDIIAQNQTLYGKAGGAPDGTDCQGLWGTVNIRDLATTGQVGGWNHSFYVQDAWTLGGGVTLNLGVRMDKENLPSYEQATGFQGVSFGWGQKVAPRLGGSWDVLRNGKFKVFGSFGYFFDIMKYSLPRGSFGGDYWHDCVYALDTATFSGIVPQRNSNGHYCPTGGGSVPAVGSLPSGMRFIENFDYREPANDPNQIGTLGRTGLVDPNLMPMKQHEIVFGSEWAISSSLAFDARYSRKRLDRTIEDAGTITQDGEVYYITNPGFGVNKVVPNCNGCPPNPKATRNYDAVEVRLTKRFTNNWTGSLSYTYSRLYGNYSGLTATDISDGGGARDGANADRAFDEAFMSFDAHGRPINGPLATDRPNTFKAYGYYNLKWWKFNTMIGAFQQLYSGTPLSSYISVWGAPVFVEGRGQFVDVTRDAATGNWVAGQVSAKRTPRFSQSDLSISQDFHVSKTNEQMIARFGVECFNCFNQKSVTYITQNLIRTSGINPAQCGAAGTNCTPTQAAQAGFDYAAVMTKGYDYIAQANTSGRTLNSLYGMPYGWQNPRTVRFTLKFSF